MVSDIRRGHLHRNFAQGAPFIENKLMRFNRVLIVDDSSTTRIMLRTYLRGLGYRNIDEAEHGDTATDLVAKAMAADDPYDLMLVDINMPKMDGIQFVNFVRMGLGGESQPHILMITAESEKSAVLRGVKAGVDSYLLKPLSPAQLEEAINKLPPHARGSKTA